MIKKGLPIVDFSLFRVKNFVMKPLDILRISVFRVAKINKQLGEKKFPGEIVDLLELIKYQSQFGSRSNKDNLLRMQTGSINMMDLLFKKIDNLSNQQQLDSLKLRKLLNLK